MGLGDKYTFFSVQMVLRHVKKGSTVLIKKMKARGWLKSFAWTVWIINIAWCLNYFQEWSVHTLEYQRVRPFNVPKNVEKLKAYLNEISHYTQGILKTRNNSFWNNKWKRRRKKEKEGRGERGKGGGDKEEEEERKKKREGGRTWNFQMI